MQSSQKNAQNRHHSKIEIEIHQKMQKRLHENSTTQTFMTTNNRQSIDFFSLDEKNSNEMKINETQKKNIDQENFNENAQKKIQKSHDNINKM